MKTSNYNGDIKSVLTEKGMMMEKSNVMIALENDLKEELKAIAVQQMRSLRNQIVWSLEQWVRQYRKEQEEKQRAKEEEQEWKETVDIRPEDIV